MTDLLQIYASFEFFPNGILILLSFLYLIPLLVSINGYKRSNSRDYLIFAGLFIAFAVQYHSTPVFVSVMVDYLSPTGLTDFWTLVILMLFNHSVWTTWMFLIFLHALRLRWDKKPPLLWATGLIFPVYALFSAVFLALPATGTPFEQKLIMELQSISLLELIFHPLVADELFRLFSFLLLIHAYLTVKSGYTSRRITAVRGIWVSIGVAHVILGVATLISVFFPTEFTGIGTSPAYQNFLSIISIYYALAFFLLGVLFPETMLISQAQINRACKLYVKVRVHEEDRSLYRFGMQHVYDYIKNIPEELFEECVGKND